MTLEERYTLSCYEEVLQLHETKQVWLVRNVENNRLYVKKYVGLHNKEMYQKLMELQVPGIPVIYACVEEPCEETGGTRLVLIEEYIHGQSLQELFEQEGVLPEQEVIRILLALCRILRPLHACDPQIVNRDIKPSNIMLTQDGVVKLVDFDAAKQFTQGQTEDTFLMGTQEYAAPEQYGFGQSTAQTDLYAMGVTMNYLLTGTYPKVRIYEGRLNKVIRKCTEVDRQARYASVNLLERELQRYAADGSKHSFKRRWNIRWLPVGFRTGTIWKMTAALYGYFIIGFLSCTLTVQSADGSACTGWILWANRLAVFFWMLGVVGLTGNYMNIQSYLPFLGKKRWQRIPVLVIYSALLFVMVVFWLAILGSV